MSTLKSRAIKGTIWTLIGYGASQGIRLASNLILTRLLVPEMFGLMALVNVFITGLHMFSDVGIGPSIIRSKRGEEKRFIDTAWTIQILRGFIIWTFCVVISYPLAKFYDDDRLLWVLPIVGFSSVILGFRSLSMIILNRKIIVGKVIFMQTSQRFLAVVVMAVWAWIHPSIWALIVGNLVSALIEVVWSHKLVKDHTQKLDWDRSALQELIGFGKWIFMSSIVTFLAAQADKILMGKLFPLAVLGVYVIAYTFSDIPRQIIRQVNNVVLFPLLSQKARHDPGDFRANIIKNRWLFLLPVALGLSILACFGDFVIAFLYDSRYEDGGWMLPLLSLGMWPFVLYVTVDPALLALGKPYYGTFGMLLKLIWIVTCLPLAHHFFGIFGVIVVIAFNDIPLYAVVSFGLWREKLSVFLQDLSATAFFIVLVLAILWLRSTLSWGSPFDKISML